MVRSNSADYVKEVKGGVAEKVRVSSTYLNDAIQKFRVRNVAIDSLITL